MVRKEDQIQMRQLLIDAVTLLCRSGMPFKTKFCVEALIGITLDDDDVVLVSFKETVCTDGTSKSQEYGTDDNEVSISNSSATTSMPLPPKRIKKEINNILENPPSQSETSSLPRKRAHNSETKIKTELPSTPTTDSNDLIKFMDCNKDDTAAEADEEDTDDCYFVKSEGLDYGGEVSGEAWEGEEDGVNYGDYEGMGDETGDYSNSGNYMGGGNFIEGVDYFDGDFSSTPQSTSSNRRTQGRTRGSLSRGSWKMRGGVNSRNRKQPHNSEIDPGAGSSMTGSTDERRRLQSRMIYQCTFDSCNYMFSSQRSLNEHFNAIHLLKKMFSCPNCGESFKWRSERCSHKKFKCPYRIS